MANFIKLRAYKELEDEKPCVFLVNPTQVREVVSSATDFSNSLIFTFANGEFKEYKYKTRDDLRDAYDELEEKLTYLSYNKDNRLT